MRDWREKSGYKTWIINVLIYCIIWLAGWNEGLFYNNIFPSSIKIFSVKYLNLFLSHQQRLMLLCMSQISLLISQQIFRDWKWAINNKGVRHMLTELLSNIAHQTWIWRTWPLMSLMGDEAFRLQSQKICTVIKISLMVWECLLANCVLKIILKCLLVFIYGLKHFAGNKSIQLFC